MYITIGNLFRWCDFLHATHIITNGAFLEVFPCYRPYFIERLEERREDASVQQDAFEHETTTKGARSNTPSRTGFHKHIY